MDGWKDLGPLNGEEQEGTSKPSDYCLVYVAQEKYGGSIVQPQKGLSSYTISIVLKTTSPKEERSKKRKEKREFLPKT